MKADEFIFLLILIIMSVSITFQKKWFIMNLNCAISFLKMFTFGSLTKESRKVFYFFNFFIPRDIYRIRKKAQAQN